MELVQDYQQGDIVIKVEFEWYQQKDIASEWTRVFSKMMISLTKNTEYTILSQLAN